MSNKIFFTPGPSQLFYSFGDHLKKAIAEDVPSISHRSSQFIKVVEETTYSLKSLLEVPDDYHIFFLNSANEAWDRIIQNLVMDSSHHFANGSFSKKFYDFAIMHGMKSTLNKCGDGEAFDSLTIPDSAELIGLTKNETSVGYVFTEDEIKAIRTKNPEKLIALDVVSASPALIVDFSQVDTAYLSVQKAFGMPAGLGLWIVNERCIERATTKQASVSLGSYRTLHNLKKFGVKNQTPETPNMLFIYIVGKIAQDLMNYGVRRLQNDIIYKATLIDQLIESHPSLAHFVSSSQHRSKSTIVAKAKNQAILLDRLNKKGLVLGKGYGPYKEEHIRIANFPTHSRESVEFLVDLIKEIE
ncbi:MAG: aminotransferase class V-fold PLP-dependent enzyme [Bacteroidota bacterium]